MPTRFSFRFKIDPKDLKKEGILNPFIDLDTRLYIHPQLLRDSKNPFLKNAYSVMQKKLARYLKIIKSIKHFNNSDISYRTIINEFKFEEPHGLCIGYSEKGTHGTGLKGKYALKIIKTIFQIQNKCKLDPEILEILPFIEENIGADRLGDMIANIIQEELATLTENIVKKYKIKSTKIIKLGSKEFTLPYAEEHKSYILLLPKDILEKLPVANSYDDIEEVVRHNKQLRELFNRILRLAAKQKTSPAKKDIKNSIKKEIVDNPNIIAEMLNEYRRNRKEPYDFDKDTNFFFNWSDEAEEIFFNYFRNLNFNDKDPVEVVRFLLEKFKVYTETNGLNKIFYNSLGKIKEEIPQRIFQVISQLYIEDKNLDLSPETNLGSGAVDFKFSRGSKKVIVEMKTSMNPKWRQGLSLQLKAYYDSEKPLKGFYTFIYIGNISDKIRKLNIDLKKLNTSGYDIEIIRINATKKKSASLLLK